MRERGTAALKLFGNIAREVAYETHTRKLLGRVDTRDLRLRDHSEDELDAKSPNPVACFPSMVVLILNKQNLQTLEICNSARSVVGNLVVWQPEAVVNDDSVKTAEVKTEREAGVVMTIKISVLRKLRKRADMLKHCVGVGLTGVVEEKDIQVRCRK